MKRFYLFCLLVLISFPIQAKNKISMVTYFPVPYVAYSQVNTTEQMDIGLTNTCDMKLGCSDESATLNSTFVNLKGGKLNLDGGRGIKGNTLTLGNGNNDGKISFQNVRIQTGTMESVNAADTKATNLNLFGKAFPSCKSANSESNGQMQWTSLKLKGASSSELYLLCGQMGESSVCQPTDSRGETYTETCPGATSSTLGIKTYTWDYTSCKYLLNDTCSYAKKYLSYPDNCLRYVDNNGQCVSFLTAPEVPSLMDSCLLAYAGLASCYGSEVHTSLPSGCSAGQPCDSCEIGHQYVYGIVDNGVRYPQYAYCGSYSAGGQKGTAYVVTTVLCYEGTKAPTQTNLNCLTGTGSGGSLGPIVAPGN